MEDLAAEENNSQNWFITAYTASFSSQEQEEIQ